MKAYAGHRCLRFQTDLSIRRFCFQDISHTKSKRELQICKLFRPVQEVSAVAHAKISIWLSDLACAFLPSQQFILIQKDQVRVEYLFMEFEFCGYTTKTCANGTVVFLLYRLIHRLEGHSQPEFLRNMSLSWSSFGESVA